MDQEPLRYFNESGQDTALPTDGVNGPADSVEPKAPDTISKGPERVKISKKNIFLAIVLFFFLLALGAYRLVSPPDDFPVNVVFTVVKGETLNGVGAALKEDGLIRSSRTFKAFLFIFGGMKGLVAGDYVFKGEQTSARIAYRFSQGHYGLEHVRVTIPEGLSANEVSELLSKRKEFSDIDESEFLELARAREGYLFPDTYFFLPNITSTEVIGAMERNFEKRIKSIEKEIVGFGRPLDDVIIMASIIEEEARTEESRRIISGILWKRLDERMPLQVDAAFAFVNGKKRSSDLTLEDLKIDSPYNTYVKVGLPPTAIANPGLSAIKATVNPIETEYYFYLSDKEGNMHYAVTHDEHVLNKERYLK